MGVGGYGYALGEKKGGEGRNVAESLFLALDGFVEPGSTKKNSDLWALCERVGVTFLVGGKKNSDLWALHERVGVTFLVGGIFHLFGCL